MHQASPTEEGDGTIHCQKVKFWPILAKIRGAMGVILIEKGILIARSNIGSVTPIAIGPLWGGGLLKIA